MMEQARLEEIQARMNVSYLLSLLHHYQKDLKRLQVLPIAHGLQSFAQASIPQSPPCGRLLPLSNEAAEASIPNGSDVVHFRSCT